LTSQVTRDALAEAVPLAAWVSAARRGVARFWQPTVVAAAPIMESPPVVVAHVVRWVAPPLLLLLLLLLLRTPRCHRSLGSLRIFDVSESDADPHAVERRTVQVLDGRVSQAARPHLNDCADARWSGGLICLSGQQVSTLDKPAVSKDLD
jgi:hypothetical protein